MSVLTVRDVPEEIHRGLMVRAARHGRSIEAEVRAILEEAVRPEGRVKLGSLLAEVGHQAALTDEEWAAAFASRDATPGRPVSFEGNDRLPSKP